MANTELIKRHYTKDKTSNVLHGITLQHRLKPKAGPSLQTKLWPIQIAGSFMLRFFCSLAHAQSQDDFVSWAYALSIPMWKQYEWAFFFLFFILLPAMVDLYCIRLSTCIVYMEFMVDLAIFFIFSYHVVPCLALTI